MLQLQVGISVIRLALANRSKWEDHDRQNPSQTVWLFWRSSFPPSENSLPSKQHLLLVCGLLPWNCCVVHDGSLNSALGSNRSLCLPILLSICARRFIRIHTGHPFYRMYLGGQLY